MRMRENDVTLGIPKTSYISISGQSVYTGSELGGASFKTFHSQIGRTKRTDRQTTKLGIPHPQMLALLVWKISVSEALKNILDEINC